MQLNSRFSFNVTMKHTSRQLHSGASLFAPDLDFLAPDSGQRIKLKCDPTVGLL